MKRFLFFLLTAFFLSQMVMAQMADVSAPQHPPRKKVALVLSGGGAKGIAHIGVLKVLEKAGIPIDIITGTSMGSLVGGMYACGHRALELDSVVRAQDWSFVLSDREDLSHQSLAEREKQNTYAFSKEINLGKNRIRDGGGLILGKNVSTLLDTYTSPYSDSIDFNTLPIPFACVATDIVTNNEIVFHKGILTRAMRASMSIPGAFSPVRDNDMVLVDGGLKNNYPADVAKEMGADYIIGVDVQSELKKANELNSASSIILQVIDYECKNKFEQNLGITDIHIKVNTKGYQSTSFSASAVDTLLRRGEEAAMAHWDEIMALKEKLGLPSDTQAIQPTPPATAPVVKMKYEIDEVKFENMTKSEEQYIRRRFKLKEGSVIDMEKADLITTAIRQDLYYKSAKFRFFNSEDHGNTTVRFWAGPQKGYQVNVGMRFDSEEMVAVQANAELPFHTKIPMDVDLTVRLGKRLMARADWSLRPMSYFKPTLAYVFRNNDVNLYEYGDKAYSMTYNQHSVELTLFNFNVRNFNFNIGAYWDYYDYHSMLVDLVPEHIADAGVKDKGYVSYVAKVWYNSENDWYFPTQGARFRAQYAYRTDNFATLEGEAGISEYSAMWRMNFPLSTHLTFQPLLYGRMLFGDNIPFVLSNLVGGEWFGHYFEQQVPFAGVNYVEMSWDKIVAAQMQLQYKPTENNVLQLRLAVGQDADKLEDLFKHQTMLGGTLSYFYKTMFGPLGGSIGYSNLTKKLYYYINLGFVF